MTDNLRVELLQACEVFLSDVGAQTFHEHGFCYWASRHLGFSPMSLEDMRLYNLIEELRKERGDTMKWDRNGSYLPAYVDTPGLYSSARRDMVQDIRSILLADL